MSETFDGSKADKYIADEFGQTGKLHFKSTKAIEFERYKQDCRKRALDLAASHQNIDITGRKFEVEKEKVISYADYYYNWLINIPQ